MTVDNKFKDEKLQDDINIEAAKISAFSSGKVEKNDYLTGKEIFPSDQRRVIQQALYLFSCKKSFRKTRKQDQGREQIDAIMTQNERSAVLTKKDDY